MTKELLQQALNTLEILTQELARADRPLITPTALEDAFKVHAALQAAIAQPEPPTLSDTDGISAAFQVLYKRKIDPTSTSDLVFAEGWRAAQLAQPAAPDPIGGEVTAEELRAALFENRKGKGLGHILKWFLANRLAATSAKPAQPVAPAPQNHVWAVSNKVAFMLFWSESAAKKAAAGSGSTYMDVERLHLLDVVAQPVPPTLKAKHE